MLNTANNLGLCRKAGCLVAGFDAVIDAVKAGKVYGVICAADTSEKTVKEITFYCEKYDVRFKRADFTMIDASQFLNKRVGVFGTNENFYGIL